MERSGDMATKAPPSSHSAPSSCRVHSLSLTSHTPLLGPLWSAASMVCARQSNSSSTRSRGFMTSASASMHITRSKPASSAARTARILDQAVGRERSMRWLDTSSV